MGKSKAVVGARGVVLKKDIKTVQQRFEKVKSEKARRIKEWKESLTDLTADANLQKRNIVTRLKIKQRNQYGGKCEGKPKENSRT